MAVETMEDAVGEEGGLEPSADEGRLLQTLRDNKMSAGQLSDRLDAHVNRPAPAPQPAAKQTVSVDEVRTMFAEHTKQVDQTQRVKEVQREIKTAIGKVVDDSGLTKRHRRRDRLVGEVFETLSGREDIAKLSGDDFQKVLVDEANKAITEEREDDGKPSPTTTTTTPSDNSEGRKTAAEAMGQTDSSEPPPKSAATTERPDPGRKFDVKNPRFGLDIDFPSDQAIQRDSSREAEEFLRDRRKRT